MFSEYLQLKISGYIIVPYPKKNIENPLNTMFFILQKSQFYLLRC